MHFVVCCVVICIISTIIMVYAVGQISDNLKRVDDALIRFEIILENSDVDTDIDV